MSESKKNQDTLTTFLSQSNLNQNYQQVVRTVKNSASLNLDRYPGMNRQFQKMAQIIAKKCDGNNVQLSNLNNKLNSEASNFFISSIQKKQNSKKLDNLNRYGLQNTSNQSNNIDVNSNQRFQQQTNSNLVDNAIGSINSNEVNFGNNSLQQQSNLGDNVRVHKQYGFSMQNNDGDVSKDYDNMIKNRNALLSGNVDSASNQLETPVAINSNDDLLLGENNNVKKSLQNALIERGQINLTQDSNNSEINNIKPFNLDNDLANSLAQNVGEDLPLYQNIKDLEDMDAQDPMKRIELLEKERQNILVKNNNNGSNTNLFNNNSNNTPNNTQNNTQNNTLNNTQNNTQINNLNNIESFTNSSNSQNSNSKIDTGILSYKDLNVEQQSNMLAKMTVKRGENDIMHERNQTDLVTYNQSVQKDPSELYRVSKEGQDRLIKSMTEGSVGNNDVRALNPLVDNLLLEKLMSLQRSVQPD